MENDVYGYIIFAKNLNNGLLSGHSQEVYEEILYNKRVIYVQPSLYNNIQNKLYELATDREKEVYISKIEYYSVYHEISTIN